MLIVEIAHAPVVVCDQILALERANHPNCVALLGIYESPSKIYIATEL
jgi:hypothetical protein